MKILNHRLLALILLAGFLWLCWYAYPRETGYTRSEVESLNRLVAKNLKPSVMSRMEQKEALVYLWGK